MTLRLAACLEVCACWLIFGGLFLAKHIRVRREREETKEKQARSLRAPASMYGLLLEGIAIGIAWAAWRPPQHSPARLIAAMLLAPLSLWLAAAAIRHLGMQWRIKAVVTEDHELVQTGPYGIVRHPIYLALFGLMLATGLVTAQWPSMVAAVVLYIVGTEIRIRAEESILAHRFGKAFEEYRRRVPAYLPFVR